jgi:hypothetical protein
MEAQESHGGKNMRKKKPTLDKKTREEIRWLLISLENASDIIVSDGLDDDHESFDVRSRMFEICERHGIKDILVGFDPKKDPNEGEFDDPA